METGRGGKRRRERKNELVKPIGNKQSAACSFSITNSLNFSGITPAPKPIVILSTPAPIPISICPARICCAIASTAVRPEEHCRLRVRIVEVTGNPALNHKERGVSHLTSFT